MLVKPKSWVMHSRPVRQPHGFNKLRPPMHRSRARTHKDRRGHERCVPIRITNQEVVAEHFPLSGTSRISYAHVSAALGKQLVHPMAQCEATITPNVRHKQENQRSIRGPVAAQREFPILLATSRSTNEVRDCRRRLKPIYHCSSGRMCLPFVSPLGQPRLSHALKPKVGQRRNPRGGSQRISACGAPVLAERRFSPSVTCPDDPHVVSVRRLCLGRMRWAAIATAEQCNGRI